MSGKGIKPTRDVLIQHITDGRSRYWIAKHYGVVPKTVYEWLKSYGLRTLHKTPSERCGGRFGPTAMNSTRFTLIRRRAQNDKIPFSITKPQVQSLYDEQNGICKLSGVPIVFDHGDHRPHRNTGTASLDRIDSCKGYVVGNLQWVHQDINRMKGPMSEERFWAWIKRLYIHGRDVLGVVSDDGVEDFSWLAENVKREPSFKEKAKLSCDT